MRPLLPVSLFLACLSLSQAASATTITGSGYTATDAIPFQWDELTNGYSNPVAGATRILGYDNDNQISFVPIGFEFGFLGTRHDGLGGSYREALQASYRNSTLGITSNGLLTFGSPVYGSFPGVRVTSGDNTPLGGGTTTLTMPIIAAAWDDWSTITDGTDGVYYATLGDPGSRRFVVEWHSTRHYGMSSNPIPVSFEVVLYEHGYDNSSYPSSGVNDTFEIRYQNMNTGNSATAYGASATVGLRDVYADFSGTYLQWSNNQSVLADQTAVRFTDSVFGDMSGAANANAAPEPSSILLLIASLGLMGSSLSRRSA